MKRILANILTLMIVFPAALFSSSASSVTMFPTTPDNIEWDSRYVIATISDGKMYLLGNKSGTLDAASLCVDYTEEGDGYKVDTTSLSDEYIFTLPGTVFNDFETDATLKCENTGKYLSAKDGNMLNKTLNTSIRTVY